MYSGNCAKTVNRQNLEYTNKPLVSIIVPVYNVEQYLAQCVNSLLSQTLKDIEIILVDDGSSDNCPAKCDAYSEQDKRVRVIHQQNSGYGKACNAGIAIANGDFIGIAESDDYVEAAMFERMYTTAKSNSLDTVCCHYYLYYSAENIRKRIDLSYIPKNKVISYRDVPDVFFKPPAVWAAIYRNDFLKSNNIRFLETPGASYQDTSFSFKVFACADRFMLIEDNLIHYRMDNGNSSTNSKDKVFCICDELKEIERFIEEKKLGEKLAPIVTKFKFLAYMWNYRRIAGKNRYVFLRKYSEEMRRHIFVKSIDKELYTTKEFAKLYIIAFLYPLFYIYRNIRYYNYLF